MKHLHASTLGLTLTLVAMLLTAPSVAGQWHTSKVTVPNDLVVNQALRRAANALEQEDLDRAIRVWQDALDRLARKVVETHRAPRLGTETDAVLNEDRFGSVRTRVMEALRAVEGGVARYQSMMEPKARRLLADGISKEDEAILAECARRYLLTDSGRAAYLSLVDLLLEHGRFEEARVTVQRLRTELPEDEIKLHGTRIAAREGLALWGSGRRADLETLIARQREARGKSGIVVGSDEVDVVAFLESLRDKTPPTTASSEATRPSLDVAKQRVWNRSFEVNSFSRGGRMMYAGRTRGPWVKYHPVVPAVQNGVVYYSDGRFLRARSLFTGNEIWPQVASLQGAREVRQNRSLHFHVVVDDDLVFGYLQGDPVMRGQSAWQGFEPIETIPAHKLVAVDRNTGELRWSHLQFNARTPEEGAFLKRLSVTQPPRVVGDTLYVAGTVLMGVFHHWVCAFERDTGHLKWRTYTGAGQMELNMFGNPVKECIPGHVTEHEGVLYYATNIGVACAVDAVTGVLLWEAAYEQTLIPSTDSTMTRERLPGWMPSAPAVHDNRVFFAPTDSFNLYAADIKDGTLTKVAAATRNINSKNCYFLGLHGGNLLIAGSKVTAINPTSLRVAWHTVPQPAPYDEASVQGRPTIVGNDVIFCTVGAQSSGSQIHHVDLQTGRFVSQKPLRYANREGNIAVSPDAIVIASERSLDAYFDLKKVEERLARATRSANADPELTMRLGDVRQRQGQWAQALQAYQKALQRARSIGPRGRHVAQRASLALFNGWLEMAEESERRIMGGPAKPEERFRRAMEFASSEAQRVRALIASMNWALREGDVPAFQRTTRLLIEKHNSEWIGLRGQVHGLFPDLSQGVRMPSGLLASLAAGIRAAQHNKHRDAVAHFHHVQIQYPDIPVGQTTAWKYAGDRIQKIIKVQGKGPYHAKEQAARRLLAQALKSNDLTGIRTVLRNYPQSSVVEKAYLELSRRLLDDGEYKEALGEMQRYFTRFGNASPAALFEYARCLDELEAHDSASLVLRALLQRHRDAVVKLDGKSLRVAGWAKKQLARPEYQRIVARREIPALDKGLQVAWSKPAGKGGDNAWIVEPRGRAPRGAEALVFGHLDRELVAMLPKDGTIVWRKAAVGLPRHATWHDGNLVIALDGDVLALDPKNVSERWRMRPDATDLRDLICGHGKVYLLLRSVVQSGLVVKGLDITSGKEVQSQGLRGFYDGSMSVSPSWLMVRVPRELKATCYDGYTGEKVGPSMSFPRDGHPPFLTERDLVVLSYGSERTSQDMVRIVARNPATGKDAWTFEAGRGTFIPLTREGNNFVFELRTPMSAGSGRRHHKVVALDLEEGTARFTGQLDASEFSIDAVITGDRLYLGVMASVKTGTGIAQKVRAYDMRHGTSPWSTAEFSGSSIRLWTYPTKDWILLRKSAPRRSRSRRGHAPELYFINSKTGRVDDLVELGKDSSVSESPGMIVRDGTLILSTGAELKGWIK